MSVNSRLLKPAGLPVMARIRATGTGVLTSSGDSSWITVPLVLVGLSVFSQMNPLLDLVISLTYLVVGLRMLNRDEYVSILAILAVFAPRLFLYAGGPSLITVFLIISVARMLIRRERLHVALLTGFFIAVLALQGLVAVYPAMGGMIAFNYATYLAVTLSLLGGLGNLRGFRVFMISWMVAALGSGVYGLVNPLAQTASEVGRAADEFVRFKGVVSDPNYLGLVLVLGVVGAQFVGHPVLRWLAIMTLLIFTARTGSLTAVVSLVAVVGTFALLWRPKGLKQLLGRLLLLGGLLGLLSTWRLWFTTLMTWRPISFLNQRWVNELDKVQGNSSSVGSGRVPIAEEYLKFFWDQDLMGLLFGGNVEGVWGLSDALAASIGGRAMPHNFQIEVLVNVGLVGWLIFTCAVSASVWKTLRQNVRKPSDSLRILVAVKVVLFVYSFSLSMYPSWWFLTLALLTPAKVSTSEKPEKVDESTIS